MFERKLVTVRPVIAIDPIPGADLIEVAQIDGWKVVVKKGDLKPRDLCFYFEIDSFIPETDERFSFLMKSGVRTFNGIRGHRLKTIRLRKQLSQGMALPLSMLPEITNIRENHDYASELNIVKWEPPTNTDTSMKPGKRRLGFPSFIRKTDQERAQNIPHEIFKDDGVQYEISEKLDGSSCTFYRTEDKVGVCSRNVLLFETEGWWRRTWGKFVATLRRAIGLQAFKYNSNNAFVRMFEDSGIKQWLERSTDFGYCNIALQGELISPEIQGNFHNRERAEFWLYDVWDIARQAYFTPAQRDVLVQIMESFDVRINHVPVIEHDASLRSLGIKNIDDLLGYAEGPGLGNKYREGLVFKRLDGKFSFKVVANSYLLKEKE